jgi:hypothetical protein
MNDDMLSFISISIIFMKTLIIFWCSNDIHIYEYIELILLAKKNKRDNTKQKKKKLKVHIRSMIETMAARKE